MKRIFRPLIAAAIVLASGTAFAQQQYINILTGGTSGVYYPLGVAAVARSSTRRFPEAKVSVQSTKASAENLNLLQAGTRRARVHPRRRALRRVEGRRRSGLQGAARQAARRDRHLPQLHPDRRQRRLGHQDARGPQGQAHLGGRAEVGHRAERARGAQGRGPHLQRLREGRVPAVRRVGRADEEPPTRRHAAVGRPGRRRRCATSPPRSRSSSCRFPPTW